MFERIEVKLRGFATASFWVLLVLWTIVSLLLMAEVGMLGVFVLILGALDIFILSALMRGFSDLISYTKETKSLLESINQNLGLGLEEKILKSASQHEQERKKEQEEAAELEKMQKEKEEKRKAAIALYWQSHQSEYDSLLEKKKQAEKRLQELRRLGSGTADEEKRSLQDLIQKISVELEKDR